jgi:hypothetical protein
MNIYLNNYKHIPDFLINEKIKCFHGEDLGDIGKFYNIEKENGYYFTVDDDIVYPQDYIRKMIEAIEKFKRKSIIAVHGSVVNFQRLNNYYKDRSLTHFKNELRQFRTVHVSGTGTTAFHTDTIKIKLKDFEKSNMADIWFALEAQKQNIPINLIPRNAGWLRDIPEALQMPSIYSTSKNKAHGEYQTKILKQYTNWKLFHE